MKQNEQRKKKTIFVVVAVVVINDVECTHIFYLFDFAFSFYACLAF